MRSLTPLLFILIVSGCDIFRSGDDVRKVILQPGMEFTYQSSFFETDSTFTDTLNIFDKITVKVSVLESELSIAGHENLIQLRVTPEGSDTTMEETQDYWYIQNREALTGIAYRNPGIFRPVAPKMAEGGYNRESGFPFSGFLESRTLNFIKGQTKGMDYTVARVPADSIRIPDDPRIVLQYPIEENNEWIAFTDPFILYRKVMEITENQMTDQSSWTASIQSWHDPEEIQLIYFDWVDRFDQHGLISRVIKSTTKRTDEHGNEIGLFHGVENVELVEVTYSGEE